MVVYEQELESPARRPAVQAGVAILALWIGACASTHGPNDPQATQAGVLGVGAAAQAGSGAAEGSRAGARASETTPKPNTGTTDMTMRVESGEFHFDGGTLGHTPGMASETPIAFDAATEVPIDAATDAGPPVTSCGAIPAALWSVAGAGTGVFSGCPARVCSGIDLAPLDATDELTALVVDTTGYRGCTRIEGDLAISQYAGTELTDLACLELVTGSFVIWNSMTLRSLHGLEALAEVDGSLEIGMHLNLAAPNYALTDFDALENLRVVRQRFALDGSGLVSLQGFPKLAAVGGDVFIQFVGGAADLAGLNALEVVGGGFQLWRPEGLQHVSGVRALASVGGLFLLWGATDMVELAGFPALGCIGGGINIGGSNGWENNALLEHVARFPALRNVLGEVLVRSNPVLRAFEMLSTVENVAATIGVDDNPVLASLPLDALSVDGYLTIHRNPKLLECPLYVVSKRIETTKGVMPDIADNLTCPLGSVCTGPVCGVGP